MKKARKRRKVLSARKAAAPKNKQWTPDNQHDGAVSESSNVAEHVVKRDGTDESETYQRRDLRACPRHPILLLNHLPVTWLWT